MISIQPPPHGVNAAYFLGYYFPRNQGDQDDFSQLLLRFKDNNRTTVSQFSTVAVKEISKRIDADVIVRILSSSERTASTGTPLDHLGDYIAKQCSMVYRPQLLQKIRDIPALKYMHANERAAAIRGAYEFSAGGLSGFQRILIIDDVKTTGYTVSEVARAIRAVLPQCEVYLFVLAHTYWEKIHGQVDNTSIYRQIRNAGQQPRQQRPRSQTSPRQRQSNAHKPASKPQPQTTANDGCFIVTAACGSETDPVVIGFREWRDEVLRTNCLGRTLISVYKRISPPLAEIIRRSDILRRMVRLLLIIPLARVLKIKDIK